MSGEPYYATTQFRRGRNGRFAIVRQVGRSTLGVAKYARLGRSVDRIEESLGQFERSSQFVSRELSPRPLV